MIAQDPHLNTEDRAAAILEKTLNPGISPCCSGLQVQGSAKSPISVTLFYIRKIYNYKNGHDLILYPKKP